MRPLRIAIASAGRFHVLDLARELHALGHDVAFYSYVPRRRTAAFGLPAACHRSLLPFAAPVLAADRLAFGAAADIREWAMMKSLNFGLMRVLEPCDLFIGMSGIYLEAARHARRRFGAAVWLERSSVHILAQDEILKAAPGAARPSAFAISRELAGYDLADRIVVPSRVVAESFRREPRLLPKLFRTPLGVDIEMFKPVRRTMTRSETVLVFVGAWSVRKGCDLLSAAIAGIDNVRLIHVGPLADAAFPAGRRFVHVDPVPQAKLPDYFAMADASLLFSREDGFGIVLAQALACDLPIICSDRTGGADLAHTPALAERIIVVPNGDVAALQAAIVRLRERLAAQGPFPLLPAADRDTLSWAAYGRRYAAAIDAAFAAGGTSRDPGRHVA